MMPAIYLMAAVAIVVWLAAARGFGKMRDPLVNGYADKIRVYTEVFQHGERSRMLAALMTNAYGRNPTEEELTRLDHWLARGTPPAGEE